MPQWVCDGPKDQDGPTPQRLADGPKGLGPDTVVTFGLGDEFRS